VLISNSITRMPEYPAHRDPKRPPMHPGELLREVVLPAVAPMQRSVIASKLGISRQALHNIMTKRAPVTPAMALRLGKLFGNGPNLWLNLQQAYDLHEEQQRIGPKIAHIKTLIAAQQQHAAEEGVHFRKAAKKAHATKARHSRKGD
jgi:antitoxin HigA-1